MISCRDIVGIPLNSSAIFQPVLLFSFTFMNMDILYIGPPTESDMPENKFAPSFGSLG